MTNEKNLFELLICALFCHPQDVIELRKCVLDTLLKMVVKNRTQYKIASIGVKY
jgi:hypothetical protein